MNLLEQIEIENDLIDYADELEVYDELNGLIHELFRDEAIKVNNKGVGAQIECMLRLGWEPENIRRIIECLMREER